jgi:hypothetical protein
MIEQPVVESFLRDHGALILKHARRHVRVAALGLAPEDVAHEAETLTLQLAAVRGLEPSAIHSVDAFVRMAVLRGAQRVKRRRTLLAQVAAGDDLHAVRDDVRAVDDDLPPLPLPPSAEEAEAFELLGRLKRSLLPPDALVAALWIEDDYPAEEIAGRLHRLESEIDDARARILAAARSLDFEALGSIKDAPPADARSLPPPPLVPSAVQPRSMPTPRPAAGRAPSLPPPPGGVIAPPPPSSPVAEPKPPSVPPVSHPPVALPVVRGGDTVPPRANSGTKQAEFRLRAVAALAIGLGPTEGHVDPPLIRLVADGDTSDDIADAMQHIAFCPDCRAVLTEGEVARRSVVVMAIEAPKEAERELAEAALNARAKLVGRGEGRWAAVVEPSRVNAFKERLGKEDSSVVTRFAETEPIELPWQRAGSSGRRSTMPPLSGDAPVDVGTSAAEVGAWARVAQEKRRRTIHGPHLGWMAFAVATIAGAAALAYVLARR